MRSRDALDWMVIGAGVAGIATVGKLLDSGVDPARVGWIDPYFAAGDLGRKWSSVPSNTRVELFARFLNGCQSFNYRNRPTPFPIDGIDPLQTCQLLDIAQPLKWVTKQLMTRVKTFREKAIELRLTHHRWEIKTEGPKLSAHNVVLATGSVPKRLSYPKPEDISLETALDLEKLKATIRPDETIGVFGASHSAILVLANLLQLEVKHVINFYRSPHRYAIYADDWILFDDTGLKGFTAQWAKEHLDGTLPKNLQRFLSTAPTFDKELQLCERVIYAVGFQPRKLPILSQYADVTYNDRTGIIAPGLFGIGIAFPQAQFDKLGNLEWRVGVWKFMDYLNTILPFWLKASN